MSAAKIFIPIEIEDAIHNNPKIYDVAVIGIPDKRLGEIVGAVIDVKEGETLTEDEFNKFIEGLLPKYKRPRKIIFDKVPRNRHRQDREDQIKNEIRRKHNVTKKGV